MLRRIYTDVINFSVGALRFTEPNNTLYSSYTGSLRTKRHSAAYGEGNRTKSTEMVTMQLTFELNAKHAKTLEIPLGL